MNIVDIFGRPFGGWLSGLPPVRKFGQSYFLAFFIGCLGLLDIYQRNKKLTKNLAVDRLTMLVPLIINLWERDTACYSIYLSSKNIKFWKKTWDILTLIFKLSFLGLLNLLSGIIIQDYDSFLIWAILFGLIYSLPVSTQIASIAEFTDVKNMNSVLSVNALILLFGVLLAPLVNGALVDITKSYS